MIQNKGGAGAAGNAVNSGPGSPSQALGSSGGIVDKLPGEDNRRSHKSPMGEDGAPGPENQQFDIEGDDNEFDENDFDHPNNEDDDDLEQQFMQQLNSAGPAIGNPGHHMHGDSGEEPMDEDDLKMYEQFLAANNKH